MFRRLVNAVEVVAALGAVAFVILLFANNPGGGAGSSSVGGQLFAANCASCHGADGSGGIGPQLSGGRVLQDFPNEADQITFVANGRGIMPGFATSLSPAQLKAVVDYTRTQLAK
ncbi:MAG TPA: cytochrome c [Acidimicrobiia bacterium]|nr:cytochrome c [Acidimicrobiia bacterium]